MKPLPHIYKAQLSGSAEGYAVVSVAGMPELRIAQHGRHNGDMGLLSQRKKKQLRVGKGPFLIPPRK